MTTYDTASIRNLALIGASGSGKTSFAEAILHTTGAISRLGTVSDGTTVSDFEAAEKDKGGSISLSVLHADHRDIRLHILDAPGMADFIGEVATAVAPVETVVLCVKAGEGVTFVARRAWDLARKHGRAACVVVTHVDEEDVDFPSLVEDLGNSLDARTVAVSLPDGTGQNFNGVKVVPFGGGEEDLADEYATLVEAVVEIDEDAMTAFLEEDKVPEADVTKNLLTQSMVAGDVVPVFCASPLDEKGVSEFLDVATACFPSPLDGPFLSDGEGSPVAPNADGVGALVFKTFSDPFVGKLCVLRVVHGEMTPAQSLTLSRTGKPEKIPTLQFRQGKEQIATDRAVAGDIVCVPKVDALETGDSLYDGGDDCSFATADIPRPMVGRAITPADHKDDAKLSESLKKAGQEDSTFTYERDEQTGQLLVHGISMLHLETVFRRIKERSNVELLVSLPRVPFRETVTAPSEGHYRHKKQSGGKGQFGEVYLKLESGERSSGLDFVDKTVGGSIPKQFMPAVEKGIRAEMAKGIVAGYPVVDVCVMVYDGKFHAVDSDEASFKMAGARAFRDAFMKGNPVLMEPLLDIEVATPGKFMGAITSDLTGRRGQIMGMDSVGDTQIVKARVPQKEVLTYPTALQALTHGEGSFLADFFDYELMPSNVQHEVMAEYQPVEDED